MSDVKDIIWVGGKRTLPNFGSVEYGQVKTLPVSLADNYIKQGLAEDRSNDIELIDEEGE